MPTLSKYMLPEAQLLWTAPDDLYKKLKDETHRLIQSATASDDFLSYRDSWVCDLTVYNVDKDPLKTRPMCAGSPSYRGLGSERSKNRFRVSKCRSSELNDAYHNELKPWARDSMLLEHFRSYGQLGKVTISILKPGGWWPSHYDFTPNHGIKVNFAISGDPKSVTLVWNNQKKRMHKISMQPGELWFVNVGMKHSAHNWSTFERIHLLLTYQKLNLL